MPEGALHDARVEWTRQCNEAVVATMLCTQYPNVLTASGRAKETVG